MKKLTITFFCILTFAFCLKTYSQVDTANWSFKTNGSDGKYTMLQNRGTFQGKAAGTVVVPFTMDINAVDTSKFLFVPIGSDGTYRLVENKSTFMGMDSGTVRAQLTYGLNESFGTAATSSGVATLNTTSGIITTDMLATTGGATFTVLNSKVTTSSVILVTAEGGYGDMSRTFCNIAAVTAGSFDVSVNLSTGTFDSEVKVHFLIIN